MRTDNAKKPKEKKPRKVYSEKHKSSSAVHVLKNVVLVIFGLILIAMLAAIIYAAVIIRNAPEIDTTKLYDNLTQSSIIYDDDGKRLDTVFEDQNRTNVDYEQLPENLVNAFVALEDKTFWKHHGFNFIRMAGAIKNKLVSGGQVSGTSTITQQLARNVYLPSRMTEHSIDRKIIEAWYTVKLEHNLSKEQIMEAYLNSIYFGFGSYGVEAASQAYFKKHVNELSLVQCAALAAIPQSPTANQLVALIPTDEAGDVKAKSIIKRSNMGVYVRNDESKERRQICLELMKDQGYIDEEAFNKAYKTKLKKFLKPNFNISNSTYSYFTDYVIDQVIADLQEEKELSYDEAWDMVYNGGLRIYSTMDRSAQKVVQAEFKDSANFPSPTNIMYDEKGNILNKDGNIAMYDYTDFFNSKKQFKFKKSEIKKNEDGSLTIKKNKRLKIYTTEVNGTTDYSLEFPTMFLFDENYKLYSISGGYINIPQEYKSLDKKGNLVVSAEFVESEQGQAFFKKKGSKYYIPKNCYTLNQKVIQPQAAMTIIENKTGQIKAMVGGRKTSGRLLYNRAIQPRQPGSSIKPLAVYGAALQQSYEEAQDGKKHTFVNYNIDKQGTRGWGDYITAGSYVIDEPTTNNGQTWPSNSGGGYSGRITTRTAIKNSINTCAYKIFMQVGADYSAKMVKKFGITTLDTKGAVSDMNPAALALGGMTNGVTTLEMANAYTTFPNNGVRAKKPLCYTKVKDASGKTIIKKKREKKRVLNSGVAWIMADMMKGVVSGGTGTAAYVNGVQAGGKTGTTSNQYDIWFDGFTPKLSASLWIGNDVNISLTSMSGYAAALWGKIMNQIPEATKGSYKEMPDSVEYRNGEYYANGTYSVAYYENPVKSVKICSSTGMRATSKCPHTTNKSYDTSKGEWPPKYYCSKHNPDPDTYPVKP